MKNTVTNPCLLAGVLFFSLCSTAGCNSARKQGEYTAAAKAQAQERANKRRRG
jgi:hypothetical protein